MLRRLCEIWYNIRYKWAIRNTGITPKGEAVANYLYRKMRGELDYIVEDYEQIINSAICVARKNNWDITDEEVMFAIYGFLMDIKEQS